MALLHWRPTVEMKMFWTGEEVEAKAANARGWQDHFIHFLCTQQPPHAFYNVYNTKP